MFNEVNTKIVSSLFTYEDIFTFMRGLSLPRNSYQFYLNSNKLAKLIVFKQVLSDAQYVMYLRSSLTKLPNSIETVFTTMFECILFLIRCIYLQRRQIRDIFWFCFNKTGHSVRKWRLNIGLWSPQIWFAHFVYLDAFIQSQYSPKYFFWRL